MEGTTKNKLLSARFLMSILFTATYCVIEVACALLTYFKVMTIEVFVAQLATFSVIVREIADAYFKREDRSPDNDSTK